MRRAFLVIIYLELGGETSENQPAKVRRAIIMTASLRLGAKLPLLLFAWALAEFTAFAMVSKTFGLLGALLLCLMTSLAGVAMLRRVGLSAALGLRRAMARGRDPDVAAQASREAALDGALAAFGALLLILPGFVSDFFGLALASPSVRAWVQGRLSSGGGRGPRARGPATLDLDPGEWTRLDQPQASRRHGKAPPAVED